MLPTVVVAAGFNALLGPRGWINLGLTRLDRGDVGGAIEALETAVAKAPQSALAHLNLGTLLIERGDFDPGMSQYAEAARLKPDDPLAHYLMAKAWLRHGNSARGVVELREAFRLNPEDFHVGTYLARVLAADEDPAVRNGSEAVRAAEQANALSQGVQPLVLDALAMAYAEAGRYQDAQQTVRQAIHTAQSVGAADWVADFQQRLELYQSGRPFREATTNLLAAPGARVRSRN
jgi:tetratricopeptide (TPR) repeat protein